jgi:hypothetical protein
VPKSFYTYRPPVLDEFKDPPGTYRFVSLRPLPETSDAAKLQSFINFQSIPAAQGISEFALAAFGGRTQLYTGSMFYRVEGSINIDPERSVPPFLYDVKIYLERTKSDASGSDCLLGRTNVKYILRLTPNDSTVVRAIGNVFNGSAVPSRLYEDSCFVPRAYVAGNSLFSTNSDQTLDHLASPGFDALNSVILAGLPGSSPSVSGAEPAGQVEIVHRDPNSITLRAQLARPAYILLQELYHPNWQAILDGRPVPVIRANQIFRAVYANKGEHTIKFYYRQSGLKTGLILSLGTLIVLLGICVTNPKTGGLR